MIKSWTFFVFAFFVVACILLGSRPADAIYNCATKEDVLPSFLSSGWIVTRRGEADDIYFLLFKKGNDLRAVFFRREINGKNFCYLSELKSVDVKGF